MISGYVPSAPIDRSLPQQNDARLIDGICDHGAEL